MLLLLLLVATTATGCCYHAVKQELQSQERAGKQILLAAAKLGVKIIQVYEACTAQLLSMMIFL
jgi:hypothetical protein